MTRSAAATVLDEHVLQEHADEIRRLGKRVVEDVVEIGRRLTEAKEIAGPGHWLGWLEREFGWSDQTARNFIHLYELGNSDSKRVLDLDLPLRDLYRLAAPSTPAQVRTKVVARAEAGEKITHATIAEILPPVCKQPRIKTRTPAAPIEERQLDNVCQHTDTLTAGTATPVPAAPVVKNPPALARDYTLEGWLAKPTAERRRIIDAWGEPIVAGMTAEKVYEALPNRTVADLERRLTFKITSALSKWAEAGVGMKFAGRVVIAGACLKMIQKILATKGLEAPTAPPSSVLSETLTAALRQALSLAGSSPNEAIAALNAINNRLDGASLDLHSVAVTATTTEIMTEKAA